jgi:hypothetical protein
MLFDFGKFKIDVDTERTRAFYAQEDVISARCSCDGCQNYEKAIDVLPHEVIHFFDELGVDIKKIRETYVLKNNPSGTLLYGGFLHLCGVLIGGNSSASHFEDDKPFYITGSFSVSFHDKCALLEKDFPLPALQLEILADIPWVLEKENPYK